MTFPIIVEPHDGQFLAKLIGEGCVSVVGATREAAVASLKAELAKRVERGELTSIEITGSGVRGLAGKYADDEQLREISNAAYADRDRERETLD